MNFTINNKSAYAYTGTRAFNPAQRTAVFIHGAANDHSVWALQSRYFAWHGWNVLAVDLPGHGQSEGPVCTSIEALTDWVATLLDAAQVKAAVVIGHSMGSLTALEVTARRPDLVSKLALVGSAVPMVVGDVLLDAARGDEEKALRMIVDWSFAPNSQLGNNHKVPGTWLPGNSLALMRRMEKGLLHNDLAACNAYVNGLAAAVDVQCPAFVLMGKLDMMTSPKAAQGVVAALRSVRTETIADAGHNMMSEAPDVTLAALWRFANSE